jgi:hypothetical protein
VWLCLVSKSKKYGVLHSVGAFLQPPCSPPAAVSSLTLPPRDRIHEKALPRATDLSPSQEALTVNSALESYRCPDHSRLRLLYLPPVSVNIEVMEMIASRHGNPIVVASACPKITLQVDLPRGARSGPPPGGPNRPSICY